MVRRKEFNFRLSLALRPLLEHLLYGFLHHLLVLVAVVAQGVLSDSTPNQRLSLCVVQTNNHGRFYILFGSDAAHSAANPAHAPRAIGGLLSLAAASGEDQVGILVLHHLLQAFALHGSLDVLLRNLRQDRVPDLVGVVGAPGVGVILRKTCAVVVIDRNLLREKRSRNKQEKSKYGQYSDFHQFLQVSCVTVVVLKFTWRC